MVRIRHNVDSNQKEVVAAFRGYGCSVKHVHMVKGFVDIVVGYQGVTHLVEIKDGSKPPSARKLTPDEQDFWDHWHGELPVIVESVDDVDRLIQAWKK